MLYSFVFNVFENILNREIINFEIHKSWLILSQQYKRDKCYAY